jgi:hypothetical protein
MAQSPTIPSVDLQGYHYVENAEWWKKACAVLPCFDALQWPDYATKSVGIIVDGQPVVIQLWKGWCQKFLGLEEFPGGVGAEVGVYRRIPGKKLEGSLDFLPPLTRVMIKKAADLLDDDLWWPYPELGATLEFEMVNPKTKKTFFKAGPQTTYWLCKWMNESSYRRYKRVRSNRAPSLSVRYTLRYKVNGKEYVW